MTFARPERADSKRWTLPFGVNGLRVAIIVSLLVIWEAVSRSGLLFQNVVPSAWVILQALGRILIDPLFYANLGVTLWEIGAALLIGGGSGVAVGVLLGCSRFLSKAYEPLLLYLGPTPKIILFPVLIMAFGVGTGSKIAMGAISCFFPVVISVAAGIRGIEPVLIRVGLSFRLSPLQMLLKIYLPAIREPIISGLRLGFGIAVIGTVLAETKLSNQGLGYMIIQTYTTFDIPKMYALLLFLFGFAMAINVAVLKYAARWR